MSHVHDSTSQPPVENQEAAIEDSTSHTDGPQDDSLGEQMSVDTCARQRRRIAQLEEKLESLESGRWLCSSVIRESNYYMAQGRALRRVVSLFDNVEELVSENDRRYEIDEDATNSFDQDRLQVGYIALTNTLRWFHKKGTEMDYDDYLQMLKMLRQGADSARGDDTSKLKALVAEWVNREFKPDIPVHPDDKHCRGFTNDACGMLLCPAELNWNDTAVKAGIRDRSDDYIVTDLSFPAYLYDKYTANPDDLEEGLFKGKILIQAFKAVFTSPSSAKVIEGDGDGADIIENNRRAASRIVAGVKVKKHVRFALSSVTSWRSVDGDFDYAQFWQTIVDFFEKAPGREARQRVDRLLEWWTRKIFGRSHRGDLSRTAKDKMSVNALMRQRKARDDPLFDSP
ncbi:hypothetical protein EDD22DRAFT_772835 [Suillus occidentalis]|nr:hypothetical protein EDD22DRAFT_772835 [Suillus occidentalis]